MNDFRRKLENTSVLLVLVLSAPLAALLVVPGLVYAWFFSSLMEPVKAAGGPVLVVVDGQLLPAVRFAKDRPPHGPGLLLALAADAAVGDLLQQTRPLSRRRREAHDVVPPLEAADAHVAEVRAS